MRNATTPQINDTTTAMMSPPVPMKAPIPIGVAMVLVQ
ncbi:hypothetical protein B4064_1128 [Caldibacillus thermoamylovorans]|nr:hypothetical protein B4064_1128 [Caldibacillus thermoamylovorans]